MDGLICKCGDDLHTSGADLDLRNLIGNKLTVLSCLNPSCYILYVDQGISVHKTHQVDPDTHQVLINRLLDTIDKKDAEIAKMRTKL